MKSGYFWLLRRNSVIASRILSPNALVPVKVPPLANSSWVPISSSRVSMSRTIRGSSGTACSPVTPVPTVPTVPPGAAAPKTLAPNSTRLVIIAIS